MPDDYIFFWGFTKNEKSYQDLVKKAPKNTRIHILSFEELIPNTQIENLEKNVLNFLNTHNLNKVTLMGTSLGGALAIIFANLHPDAVQKLILVDCEGIYSHTNVVKAGIDFILAHNSGPENKFNRNLQATLRSFSKPIFHFKAAWLAHHIDIQEQAKSIQVPTIIIWAENDHITPLWQGQKLHQLIPNSKLITLQNLDHDWILYYPDKFWENV